MSNLHYTYKVDLLHDGDFVSTQTGDLEKVSLLSNLMQALYHRLITSKGSLSHRPDYGVGIKSYQNSLYSLSTQRDLIHNIKNQFMLDHRVESVDSIQFFQPNLSKQIFSISIKITAIGLGSQTLTLSPFED